MCLIFLLEVLKCDPGSCFVPYWDFWACSVYTVRQRSHSPTYRIGNTNILLDSVHYLPLAEATIFRFLVPITTALACSSFLGERLSTKELGAGVVALLGIVVIAHPASIFDNVIHDIRPHETDTFNELTPRQHLIAIIVAIIGIFGASGAYTMIRIIEHRAHTLISVNYFAILSTVVSAVALLVIPDIGFTMPEDVRQWCLLLSMGFLGFALQFLLTAGLQLDRSSRATSMMYSQLIFALMYDFVIWGMLPGMWTLIGGAIVTASTLWAALQRKVPTATIKDVANDEESALLQHRRVDEQISAKRSSFEA